MYSSAELQLIYKVANAPVNNFPYPHIYVPDVFPDDFYAQMQQAMPDPQMMLPISEVRPVKGYKERFVLDFTNERIATLPQEKQPFWTDFKNFLLAGRFGSIVLSKFRPFVERRFQKDINAIAFREEMLLVEDITKYALGPHTDSPKKVITMLFYLPKDNSQSHLGTSIYVPKDINFSCEGGPHHQFDGFSRVTTMPFKPNSLFAFVKTNNSFHGVEPVTDPDTRRWLLLYDIYLNQQPANMQPAN